MVSENITRADGRALDRGQVVDWADRRNRKPRPRPEGRADGSDLGPYHAGIYQISWSRAAPGVQTYKNQRTPRNASKRFH
jgi:hypothetical protein